MNFIDESTRITGIKIVKLQSYADDRGRFMETFRKEWFPQRRWNVVQCNRSDSKKGVLRGLHYHLKQADYWYVLKGRLRAGLVDLRPFSETFLNHETIEMGEENEVGLLIPEGIAHGFIALTDVILTYVVDRYFSYGDDEFGVAWNDPLFDIKWGIKDPIVSQRDQSNRRFQDIPKSELPKMAI
ncbi:MAG: dTDP-4-dehydrorhamnose 3,5-epimerase family protein [Candidatus Promineifilaceae bacterium]|nr:dTDP-4-dehydrorhamnose 3,5-epimerase family protein [Candidatus Promineifilaceae bacterium]